MSNGGRVRKRKSRHVISSSISKGAWASRRAMWWVKRGAGARRRKRWKRKRRRKRRCRGRVGTRDTVGKAVAVNELIGEHAEERAERRWAETARRAEWQKRGARGGKCPKTRIVQYERVLRMG